MGRMGVCVSRLLSNPQMKYGQNGPGTEVRRYSADPAQNRLVGKSDPNLGGLVYDFYSYLQPFGRARQMKYGQNGPGTEVGRYSAHLAQNRLVGKSDINIGGVCFMTFIHISNRLAVLAK